MNPSEIRNVAREPRRYRFHVHVAVIFTGLTLLSGGLMVWHSQREISSLALSASQDVFRHISRETVADVGRLQAPIETLVDLLAQASLVRASTLEQRLESLAMLREALTQNARISALYVGYDDGDFFLLRPLRDAALRTRFAAPTEAQFLVQSVEHDTAGVATGAYLYLDAGLAVLRRDRRSDYVFDPRTRGWFESARVRSAQTQTAPYVFFSTREVGTTFARASADGRAVVGADLVLTELSRALAAQQVSPSAELALFMRSGEVMAYRDQERAVHENNGQVRLARLDELGAPVLEQVAQRVRAGDAEGAFEVSAQGRRWVGLVAELPGRLSQTVYLAVAAPRDELLTDAQRILREELLISLALLAVAVPLVWFMARRVAKPLRRIAREAEAIRRFDFRAPVRLRSRVLEIDELARSMGTLKSTIANFIDVGASLSAERDFDRLLAHLLFETLSISRAHAGLIYLMLEDERTLRPAALRRADGAAAHVDLGDVPLGDDSPYPALVRALMRRDTVVAPIDRSDPLHARFAAALDAGDRRTTLVAVPLVNRQGHVVGLLCLLAGEGEEIAADRLALIQALSGTAALAIESHRLLQAQKDLFVALIEMLAGAIDAKSRYTGGHCQRVPELAKLLARAACDATDGPFASFSLDADQWEALHIAAWLHDCGKVTTPDFVVDKATKLETLYDRIHEVRMRFEVLKRDARIACLEGMLDGGDAAGLRAVLQTQLQQLDEDFAFVAQSNLGAESLDAEAIVRLKEIGARTWQRTLDDRIGISWEEAQRKSRNAPAALPATERLLDDKPEHEVARGDADRMPAGNPWGFHVDVPALKYNRGELYNLAVGRGTLTTEERFQINDHMAQTIIMLTRLPFPRHLRDVPEIAGGHHEKMDGTGYPRRLTREQMSVPARMMAIADIFEALTAIDRPYKRGKTLSESLAIMARMRRDKHIDGDLFELFVRSGVYLDYARRFLQPAQIDEVDQDALLRAA
ncbi:MAG TPA: HD domain-containing phosphohydrolase [Rhodocyclaceae bacterium]|nr:HD domain-containing phosphohydrolase [Rhodocyclaceae bacterium]HMZ83063.1 HD domain-containing phosphohydrolase [Rhodocyclaceae bacterium]HNA02704.1 HD domain-containing phosphohydrolase [Rhodocyclaceae bacterium]HNB77789.1 HD domain-containing phosphohydrolase [Rhodocyclaceae bacterium]HNC62436.1 HD domain-containing phosphohydrolase [Rhodocyclaceae bacterium]